MDKATINKYFAHKRIVMSNDYYMKKKSYLLIVVLLIVLSIAGYYIIAINLVDRKVETGSNNPSASYENDTEVLKYKETMTFVPSLDKYAFELDRHVSDSGIWYQKADGSIAYYDFNKRSDTYISQGGYQDTGESYLFDKCLGDYLLIRHISATDNKSFEYIILNKSIKSDKYIDVKLPDQVYSQEGNELTSSRESMKFQTFSDADIKGVDAKNILIRLNVVKNDPYVGYYYYIELNLETGKVTKVNKQDFDKAQDIAPQKNQRYSIESEFFGPVGIVHQSNTNSNYYKKYLVDSNTGQKVEYQRGLTSCFIVDDAYLACGTAGIEWWTDNNKTGFVYWPISEIMK